MRFPAYGKALDAKRRFGHRPRVVALLVGDDWRRPKWLPADIPRLAVKNGAWHEPRSERFDWCVVAACSVLSIDTRLPGERASGPEDWDSWLWLLADVQRFAREVLLFTPTLDFVDPQDGFAAERCLEIYAWCNGRYHDGQFRWPPWWPYGDRVNVSECAA